MARVDQHSMAAVTQTSLLERSTSGVNYSLSFG